MLGYSPCIAAARAGEPYAARLELPTIELIGAGADCLNETKALRALEQGVAPEARDHHHVSFADPALELVQRSNFEAVDRHLPMPKLRLQLIGSVGKTDRQALLGRKH